MDAQGEETAPRPGPSSSFDQLLGELDATLAADPSSSPARAPPSQGATATATATLGDGSLDALLGGALDSADGGSSAAEQASTPAPAPAQPQASAALELSELLKATGLGEGGSGGIDDDFDDIFGGSAGGGGGRGASGEASGGGAMAAATTAPAAASSSGKEGAWKNFDAMEKQDFLRWLEEDDVAQGLDTSLLLGTSTNTATTATSTTTSTAASKPAPPSTTSPATAKPPSSSAPPRHPLSSSSPGTVVGAQTPAAAPGPVSLDSLILNPRRGPVDMTATMPEAVLERIKAMLAAAAAEEGGGGATGAAGATTAPKPQQHFFGSSGEEGEGGATATDPARRLQAYCEDYGRIPEGLRSQAWRLLLPRHDALADGYAAWRATTLGQQQQQQQESGGEGDNDGSGGGSTSGQQQLLLLETVHRRHQVPNEVLIRRDAAAVARAFRPPGEEGAEEEIVRGLIFYCKQMRLDYEPVLGPVYGALASLGWGGEPQEVFGRFHAFCAWLLPYALMAPEAREEFVKEVHVEFRLLLTYHAPLLVQHLDRFCPGWEAPPSTSLGRGGDSLSKTEQARADAEAEDILGALEGKWSSKQQPQQQHQQPSPSTSTSTGGETEGSALRVEREASLEVERTNRAAAAGGKGGGGDGLIPTSWLLGLFSGSALLPPAELLELWDGCLVRGDRYLGVFLAAAFLLRHKTDLLSLQGAALRQRLEALLLDVGGARDTTSGSSSVGQWLEDAARLERTTPVSFRVQLSALEAAARGAVIVRALPSSSSSTNSPSSDPALAPTPPQTAPPSAARAQEDKIYAARLAALNCPRQRAIDEMQRPQAAGLGASTSTSASPSSSRWALASPTRRRRALQQAQSDPDALALLSTRLCLTVAPEEAVPQLCLPSNRQLAPGGGSSSGEGANGGGNRTAPTQQLKFFGLDCRPKEQLSSGRFPTAYHLDPARLEDPEEITRLMTTLEPFKGGIHILLVGSGDRSGLVAGGGVGINPSEKSMAGRMREQLQRAAREDLAHLHTAALFLLKRGFPYVSILDGGFMAVHAYLLARTRAPGGSGGLGLSALIDHVPNNCRMCKHEALVRFQRDQTLSDSYSASASGGGGLSGSGSGSGKAMHRAGSSEQGGAPSLAALSQLGQSSLDVLRSKATGLLGKLGQAGSQAAASADGGSTTGSGPAPIVDVHEVGSFLKGTVANLTKRAEQAMEARGVKVPGPLVFGAGAGLSASASGAAAAAAAASGGGGGKAPSPVPPAAAAVALDGAAAAGASSSAAPVFVIEDDEEDEDEEGGGGGPQPPSPSPPVAAPVAGAATASPGAAAAAGAVKKRTSDVDREMALKLHALHGLQKGQEVLISPESLPGAQLFPVYKQKAAEDGTTQELPRYLALTPERLLVLETVGGLSALGKVKSNHHLTELGKMTFMKKDPEVVQLYFRQGLTPTTATAMGGGGQAQAQAQTAERKEDMKRRAYRISRKEEFIKALQENLRRFK